MANYPSIATGYGASKASLNWITRRIHFDHPELIAFPIYPGYVCLAESISNVLIRSDQNTWVQSEMGNMGARLSGLSEAPVSIKDCADAVISRSTMQLGRRLLGRLCAMMMRVQRGRNSLAKKRLANCGFWG
jgi:norsolorinic acid ketoreductase